MQRVLRAAIALPYNFKGGTENKCSSAHAEEVGGTYTTYGHRWGWEGYDK